MRQAACHMSYETVGMPGGNSRASSFSTLFPLPVSWFAEARNRAMLCELEHLHD